jgi:peptidoglycan/LPS O-acetylase OafA/YrhL
MNAHSGPTRPRSPAAETQPDVPLPGPGTHSAALDGLRGLAVLLVVVFHIFQVESTPTPTQTLPRLLYMTTRLGQTGVDLFFVLSGFLITGILFDTKGAPRYFRNFYGRRTVRIFPLYYGVLVVALLVVPRLFGPRDLGIHPLWLWTYTANLPMSAGAEATWFGHFWTLAIEEQFYLVWPAVVFAFGRTTLMRVCLGCIAGAAVCRVLAEWVGISSFSFTLCRMDSLTLGAWLALAARGPEGLRGWRTMAMGTALATALVMTPLYILKTGTGDAWVQVVKFTTIAVFHGALLALAITAPPRTWTGRLFRCAPLCGLGRYSYGMYVYHPFVIAWLARALASNRLGPLGFSPAAGLGLRFGAIFSLSFGAAWLSWHLYEKPLLGLKAYFAYEGDAGARPGPSAHGASWSGGSARGVAVASVSGHPASM